jgi:hypothetical protein
MLPHAARLSIVLDGRFEEGPCLVTYSEQACVGTFFDGRWRRGVVTQDQVKGPKRGDEGACAKGEMSVHWMSRHCYRVLRRTDRCLRTSR